MVDFFFSKHYIHVSVVRTLLNTMGELSKDLNLAFSLSQREYLLLTFFFFH